MAQEEEIASRIRPSRVSHGSEPIFCVPRLWANSIDGTRIIMTNACGKRFNLISFQVYFILAYKGSAPVLFLIFFQKARSLRGQRSRKFVKFVQRKGRTLKHRAISSLVANQTSSKLQKCSITFQRARANVRISLHSGLTRCCCQKVKNADLS